MEDLARKAGVAKGTIVSFEKSGRVTYEKTLTSMRSAFEEAGIVFLSERGRPVGLRFEGGEHALENLPEIKQRPTER